MADDAEIARLHALLSQRPDDVQVLSDLANALWTAGAWNGVIEITRRLLRLRPREAQLHWMLGNAHYFKSQLDEAIAAYRSALELNPQNETSVRGNLANALWRSGRVSDSIQEYDRAIARDPQNARIASNRLLVMQYDPRFDARTILRQNQEWDRRFAQPLYSPPPGREADAGVKRRIRIGYVSAHFDQNVLALYSLPLLAAHDREQFEIICYSSVAKEDDVTRRLRADADVWREIAPLSDQQAAELIRFDHIDVLADLDMRMAKGRPLLFARKPASLQIAWMSYPGTTGMSAMDARLTDPYLDAPGEYDDCYSENSIRLPDTFWCYDATALDPNLQLDAGPLPLEKNGHITFGCLNNFCKVNEGVLDLWSGVLREVAASRLLLLCWPGECRRWVIEQLGRRGIAAERIDFVSQQSRRNYLAEYRRIDIGLDTLPYNGHTTSLDSYWMGVPVVTRVGRTIVGRAGWSQLSNLALTELAARDDERFVKIAVELAADQPRLSELRRTLRQRLLASPLADAKRFARGLETAYKQLLA